MSEFNRLDKLLEYMEENRGVFGWKSQCEALIELAERLESEIDSKDKLLAGARAEIERKNAIIGQMREALSLVMEGAIHDFHYACQHRNSCLCWGCQKKRVNAALAAERGE